MLEQERTIKKLKSQLAKLQGDSEALLFEISTKQREQAAMNRSIRDLKLEISKLSQPKEKSARVTEHAILRYLERVKGLNLEEIESEILCEKVLSLVERLGGNGTYPADGFSVVMKDRVIVTIT